MGSVNQHPRSDTVKKGRDNHEERNMGNMVSGNSRMFVLGGISASIASTFEDIRESIVKKGIVVPENTPYEDYPMYIDAILTGDKAQIGNRVYKTVVIGGKTWMAENLDYKFDGCTIGTVEPLGKACASYYDNNESMYGIDNNRHCGLLYNYEAVTLLNENKERLITGWHVPSSIEMQSLLNSTGNLAANLFSLNNTSLDKSWPKRDGKDLFGFSMLPAGLGRYNGSSFEYVGTAGYLWCCDLYDSENVKYYGSYENEVTHNLIKNGYLFSLRLVKD